MYKRMSLLVVVIFTFLNNIVAFADPIKRLKTEMESDAAEEIGWGILAPALKIIAIIFFVLGIVAIVVGVGYLLLKGIKMIFGRANLGKNEIGKAFVVILIGVLVSGGSWFGIIELGNKVIIEPVNNEIIQSDNKNNPDEGKKNESAPTPTPNNDQN